MNKAQQKRYDSLYRKHVSALKRQGKAEATIDGYSRALRRLCEFFDCPPDVITSMQLEAYFESLVAAHSWSTVKVDRNGLQFFYKHTAKAPMDRGGTQKSFKAIVQDVGIHKAISIHSSG